MGARILWGRQLSADALALTSPRDSEPSALLSQWGRRVLDGLWHLVDRKENLRMLVVGLDGAGKTTFLYKLKLGDLLTTVPTIGFNVEQVRYRNITFTVLDVGGQDKIRPLWKHYYQGTDGLIFIVDSNDLERLGNARHELSKLLEQEHLKEAALLVFANKQELPGALPVQDVTHSLGLREVEGHPWFVQPSCAITGDGLYEGLGWLSDVLTGCRN